MCYVPYGIDKAPLVCLLFLNKTHQERLNMTLDLMELGKTWNGMDWIGLEWNGMDWNGMDWNGLPQTQTP